MSGAPYRGGVGGPSASSPDETGLVADLIAQFADRLAFYRELVQNAIDAGSVSIGVRITWEPGLAVVAVRDVGVGMSRDVIEEELLVLFRSGKEGQEDAIGKFGVGFVSVLAVDPEVVEVHTSTGDGAAHVLHLRRDQSWELFEVDGGTSAGSTVKHVGGAVAVWCDPAPTTFDRLRRERSFPSNSRKGIRSSGPSRRLWSPETRAPRRRSTCSPRGWQAR
ncbi:MAG: ATP-binding protein [Deltaproteobacteria bacterium]|nr:ATP-binding protein [Deltaproteobacteria bacterium]